MQAYNTNPLQEEERSRARAEKADRFWNAFQITENGKVKSTLLLNSFCLAAVFIAIYFAAFALMLTPLQSMVENAPVWVGNLVGAVVPAFIGTLACLAMFPLFKEKRTIPCTYLWIFVLAVACLVTMVIMLWGENGTIILLMQFMGLFILCPVVFGSVGSALLYKRWRMAHPLVSDNEKLRR